MSTIKDARDVHIANPDDVGELLCTDDDAYILTWTQLHDVVRAIREPPVGKAVVARMDDCLTQLRAYVDSALYDVNRKVAHCEFLLGVKEGKKK